MQLLKDITLLDGLYDKNIEYMHELDVYILAGSLKLTEINEKIIPQLKEKAKIAMTQWMLRMSKICLALQIVLRRNYMI